MASFLRRARKRKQKLGEVPVVPREEYAGMDLDSKIELIRGLIPLGLMHVQELLDDEVLALAGARHARDDRGVGTRHGSNPGTVRLAGQKTPMALRATPEEESGRDW